MNAVDRNTSGSCRKVTAPIRLSSVRVTRARAFDSALNPVPSRPPASTSIATPSGPPSNETPIASASPTM
jgi:hypothetical protein